MEKSAAKKQAAETNANNIELRHKIEFLLENAWSNKAVVIRQFLDNRVQYEQLCDEITYILRKRLDEKNIEYANVSGRAKTLNSFIEKLQRKTYEDPFKEITDFSGVRIVFLYLSDRNAIEELIEAEFEVVEKVDKVDEQGSDRFGYGALHYLVNIGHSSSGARYDDLKNLVCEIQVRIVLQDAWAIIDHHLMYKQASAIPQQLRRKVNALAGSFETADDQFDQLREQRRVYLESIQQKGSDAQGFLNQDLNLETFLAYMQWKFPDLPVNNVSAYNI